MRRICTLAGLALITYCVNVVSCDESSEEVDVYKNYKKCPGGYCLQLHLCNNGSANIDGNGLIELRFADDTIDVDLNEPKDPCEEFLLRCCAVNETKPTQATTEKLIPDLSNYDDIIQPDIIKPDIIKSVPPSACGTNRPNGYVYRVQNKGIGQIGEFPWMAVLMQRDKLLGIETSKYICGGSLIHPQVILTAAHCVSKLTNALETLVARLGEWDFVTENEPLKHEDRAVQKIILHENLTVEVAHNDLALLILDKQASLNVQINPICLPHANDDFNGQRCVVSGWGKENFKDKEGKYAEVVKKIEVPVIPRKNCKKLFRATSLGPFFRLHNSLMCAGGEADVDMCQGDGGSPLACQRDGVFVQVGIVAWGIGCGGEGVPGAYVNVTKFVDWIENKIHEENL